MKDLQSTHHSHSSTYLLLFHFFHRRVLVRVTFFAEETNGNLVGVHQLLFYLRMIPIIASTTTRIGFRPGMLSLASSRQIPLQQNFRSFHGYRYTSFSKSPRTTCDLESIKQHIGRRFMSNGGAKPGQNKESPISPFSKFWKSYLGPKPMPERWTAAWYREMVLICTVFAITGSSTMVLVSLNLNIKNVCCNHVFDETESCRNSMNSDPLLLCLNSFCSI